MCSMNIIMHKKVLFLTCSELINVTVTVWQYTVRLSKSACFELSSRVQNFRNCIHWSSGGHKINHDLIKTNQRYVKRPVKRHFSTRVGFLLICILFFQVKRYKFHVWQRSNNSNFQKNYGNSVVRLLWVFANDRCW